MATRQSPRTSSQPETPGRTGAAHSSSPQAVAPARDQVSVSCLTRFCSGEKRQTQFSTQPEGNEGSPAKLHAGTPQTGPEVHKTALVSAVCLSSEIPGSTCGLGVSVAKEVSGGVTDEMSLDACRSILGDENVHPREPGGQKLSPAQPLCSKHRETRRC